MKTRKLKFKKEIVANLSGAESEQIKGGNTTTFSCWESCFANCETDASICWGSCEAVSCHGANCNTNTCDPATGCCGPTYRDCTNHECLP